jgi:hypothetical protein
MTPDPGFVDWEAYAAGRYTPPPRLLALPDAAFILSGWGGRGWGFGDDIERERAAAAALKAERP